MSVERVEKCPVLHDRVIDLGLEKLWTTFHNELSYGCFSTVPEVVSPYL
jgi:hypothetical protein